MAVFALLNWINKITQNPRETPQTRANTGLLIYQCDPLRSYKTAHTCEKPQCVQFWKVGETFDCALVGG